MFRTSGHADTVHVHAGCGRSAAPARRGAARKPDTHGLQRRGVQSVGERGCADRLESVSRLEYQLGARPQATGDRRFVAGGGGRHCRPSRLGFCAAPRLSARVRRILDSDDYATVRALNFARAGPGAVSWLPALKPLLGPRNPLRRGCDFPIRRRSRVGPAAAFQPADRAHRHVVVANRLTRQSDAGRVFRRQHRLFGNRHPLGLTSDEYDATRRAAGVPAAGMEDIDLRVLFDGENQPLPGFDFEGPELFDGEFWHLRFVLLRQVCNHTMRSMPQMLKALARRPAFATVAIVTLALGLGANAAIFSVIDAALLRPLPFPKPDRLVAVWEYSAEMQQRLGLDRLPSSPGNVTDFRSRNNTLAALASMRADRVNLTGTGTPERVGAVRVSVEFFDVLGVAPIVGRTFSPSDLLGGTVVVIGEGLWRRRFAETPDVSGRALSVNGQAATVVGVMPASFRFPSGGELPEAFGFSSRPELWTLDVLSPERRQMREGKSFAMIARLKDGITRQQAEADLNTIAAQIAEQFPDFNAGWTVRVFALRDQLVGSVRPALLVLLASVGFVLLIACTNVANLLLVRAAARQREFCVRHALGASRRRLIGEQLLESITLSLIAGAIGVLLAWWGLRALLLLLPSTLPAVTDAALDVRVLVFTILVAVVTGVLFGLVPAVQGTRTGISEGLREGGRTTVGGRRSRLTRNILVIAEVGLASVLLISAALLIQTFVRLLNVETGFRARGALTMELVLPRAAYSEQTAHGFYARPDCPAGCAPGSVERWRHVQPSPRRTGNASPGHDRGTHAPATWLRDCRGLSRCDAWLLRSARHRTNRR